MAGFPMPGCSHSFSLSGPGSLEFLVEIATVTALLSGPFGAIWRPAPVPDSSEATNQNDFVITGSLVLQSDFFDMELETIYYVATFGRGDVR